LKKIRIALVGLGDIAQKAYLPIIANHPEVLPILCTRNPETLAKLQTQYRINESYTDIQELIANKPDAIMIHTATSSHFSLAEQCIKAGIATFVDKPLSFDIAECENLVALARKNDVPFYVGFNRRFAPLISPLLQKELIHVRWQKNRVSLPATPREFVFNDFIHLVDGLRFLAKLPLGTIPEVLRVNSFKQGDLLANITIGFEYNDGLFEASMNRLSGITEEKLEVFSADEKYHIESLTHGSHYKNGSETALGFTDWHSYLFTRGFEHMITDWVNDIKKGSANNIRLQEIIASHRLCEAIVTSIEQ